MQKTTIYLPQSRFLTFTTGKRLYMTQEITLTIEESHLQFIRQHAAQTGTTISKIVNEYLELLQKVDVAYQREEIHPAVATVSGLVSTGRNETKDTIFE